MAEVTGIDWADSTFNGWIGCTKVGPGCDHCYAEEMDSRKVFKGETHWGNGAERMLTSVSNWNNPVRWNSAHDSFFAEHGRRRRVFCSSLADVFDNNAPEGARERLWALIKATPNLDWLLLTKRIGNAKNMLPADWGDGYPNVWLGASIVNQEEADRDILKLLKVPAKVRFLSMEPLLGPVDIGLLGTAPNDVSSQYKLVHELLHWIIAGGESGPHARPVHSKWIQSLRDQCEEANVPFLFKQWGEFLPMGQGDFRAWEPTRTSKEGKSYGIAHFYDPKDKGPVRLTNSIETAHVFTPGISNPLISVRVGKKEAGRTLDGRIHDEFPVVNV